jgi:uncharacterized protein (TIGR02391 family)
MVQKIEMIDAAVVRAIAAALCDTEGGLTNTAIVQLFRSAGVPPPPAGTKRDRVAETLLNIQAQDQAGNIVTAFVSRAMEPVRFVTDRQGFTRVQTAVNSALVMAGFRVTNEGKVSRSDRAANLDEMARLAGHLRVSLMARDAHPEVLRYTEREVIEQNPFHAMQEAVKGVSDRLRLHTGFGTDGAVLIDACFANNPARIQITAQRTESEASSQKGFANLLKGLHGHFRNPTAHATRLTWPVAEADFLDLCSTLSYVHRQLDQAGVSPTT